MDKKGFLQVISKRKKLMNMKDEEFNFLQREHKPRGVRKRRKGYLPWFWVCRSEQSNPDQVWLVYCWFKRTLSKKFKLCRRKNRVRDDKKEGKGKECLSRETKNNKKDCYEMQLHSNLDCWGRIGYLLFPYVYVYTSW